MSTIRCLGWTIPRLIVIDPGVYHDLSWWSMEPSVYFESKQLIASAVSSLGIQLGDENMCYA